MIVMGPDTHMRVAASTTLGPQHSLLVHHASLGPEIHNALQEKQCDSTKQTKTHKTRVFCPTSAKGDRTLLFRQQAMTVFRFLVPSPNMQPRKAYRGSVNQGFA